MAPSTLGTCDLCGASHPQHAIYEAGAWIGYCGRCWRVITAAIEEAALGTPVLFALDLMVVQEYGVAALDG